jgi:hypothetical protein
MQQMQNIRGQSPINEIQLASIQGFSIARKQVLMNNYQEEQCIRNDINLYSNKVVFSKNMGSHIS